jgi:predicted transcriptional regulator
MPQSERSDVLKKILKWINSKEHGATMAETVFYAKWEITLGGAIDRTIKSYIEDLFRAGMLEYQAPFYLVTKLGKQWLERHGI